jgi:hypothetical protein
LGTVGETDCEAQQSIVEEALNGDAARLLGLRYAVGPSLTENLHYLDD